MIVPAGTPLALKPAPETLTLEIVTFELPEFVRPTVKRLLLPTFTFPKLKLVGLAVISKVAAFTVRVAALLVALPAEFVTTTVKSAPLSAVVSAGVV